MALYDVTEDDEAVLDEWEGVEIGLYRKIRVRVQTLDGEQTAWVYVLERLRGRPPLRADLGILADAAEAAGAPDDYVAELRAGPAPAVAEVRLGP